MHGKSLRGQVGGAKGKEGSGIILFQLKTLKNKIKNNHPPFQKRNRIKTHNDNKINGPFTKLV